MEWFFSVWTTLDYIWSVSSSATPCNIYNRLQHTPKFFCQWSHVPLYQPQDKVAIYQNKWYINTSLPYTFQISYTSPYIRCTSLSAVAEARGYFSLTFMYWDASSGSTSQRKLFIRQKQSLYGCQVPESLMLVFFSDTLSHIWALGKLTGM